MPVGSFKPNAWGLHDMLGNVAEMTGSAYYGIYQGAEQRQAENSDGASRVARGGSWHRDLSSLRLAWRGETDTGTRRSYLGLRLARD
jgi:formylglycine-generating enzyme required for sulfatase activity